MRPDILSVGFRLLFYRACGQIRGIPLADSGKENIKVMLYSLRLGVLALHFSFVRDFVPS